MNAPIPLRPDVNALREAAIRSLTRAAIDAARNVNERVAKSSWPDDAVTKLITRAATTQLTIADTAAFQQVAVAFVASLVPVSAAAAVIARSLQLDLGTAAQISVPSLTLPYAEWTGEGKPIPVLQGTSAPGTRIEPYKIAALFSLTGELVRGSNAEHVMRQVLLENAGPTLDAAMFTADAAVPGLRPAGILSGIAPLPQSAAASKYDAMVEDIAAIATALAPAAGSSEPMLVCAPAQYVPLSMNARNPWAVAMSAALPAGTIVGVVPSGIASSISAPRVEATTAAAVHHADPAADISDIGGVLAAPVLSTFQIDAVNLKFVQPATWSLRSPAAVAWIEATSW